MVERAVIGPLVVPLLLTVRCNRVVRHGADHVFGINLNYIRDRDSNRPAARPLDAALADMGVRWLRFPGGEKSNYHVWAEPPYTKPAPTSLGWYAKPKGDRMDFDEYIRHVRAIHAAPYVVVACDPRGKSGRTLAQQLEAAVAWVRYAKEKHDGVQTWEIGNENWSSGKAPPAETARIVVEFARAMKAVDPSIRIGASGDNDSWWKVFLPIAAPELDFLSVSQYTGWAWGSYDRFLRAPGLMDSARVALNAIDRYAAPSDRARLRVIVAETNAKDYAEGGWPDADDLGHALVTFATLGAMVAEPRIEAAMVWTTRWMTDADSSASQFYAVGPHNEVTPTGQAIKAWAHFVEPDLLETDGGDDATQVFATRTGDGRAMTVWLLNRGPAARDVRLRLDSRAYGTARRVRFGGPSPADPAPTWTKLPDATLSDGVYVDPALPPYSITILSLGAA